MEIKLQDEDFAMFKNDAKKTLEVHVATYTHLLKSEAERVALSQFQNKEDAKVYDNTVKSVIGIHGHHVFKKPNVFFTYIHPIIDIICGAGIGALLSTNDKSPWHGALLATAIIVPIILYLAKYFIDSKD